MRNDKMYIGLKKTQFSPFWCLRSSSKKLPEFTFQKTWFLSLKIGFIFKKVIFILIGSFSIAIWMPLFLKSEKVDPIKYFQFDDFCEYCHYTRKLIEVFKMSMSERHYLL